MYRKILVPLDGSKLAEQILPCARSLAEAGHASVELLRVNQAEATVASTSPPQGGEYLDEVAKKFFSPATQVEKIVVSGSPATVIVERAGGDLNCLIAMATHGMSGIRRWLMGSVASKVAQSAANPLPLIRPTEESAAATSFKAETIFLPLDGSGLAERALAHAASLAGPMNSEIHLLRVYTVPSNAYVLADGVITQGLAQFREAMQQEAAVYLDGKVEGLRADGFRRVTATAIEGDPAGEIID
ncbi:MAG: universal stress protein, partial [Candidatus Binatia bacterium]